VGFFFVGGGGEFCGVCGFLVSGCLFFGRVGLERAGTSPLIGDCFPIHVVGFDPPF